LRLSYRFLQEILSESALSSAEILDFGHYRAEKNSGQPAVFRCSSALSAAG